MRSSYIQHNYGDVFYRLIRTYGGRVFVELGVLDGYSTMAIARAIRDDGSGSKLDAYDLFEDYKYNHGVQEEVQQRLNDANLAPYVNLVKADALTVSSKYEPNSVNFLHVDLSNTGTILNTIMKQWDEKMVWGGLILFEGGSEERDNVEWMKKYNMEPIKSELENNSRISGGKYVFGTYLKFPSLTCLMRKHG